MSAITPSAHQEARAFLHRLERLASPGLIEQLEQGAPPAPWHDLRAQVMRADFLRAKLVELRADPRLSCGGEDFIDYLLTGSQPFIGFCSSKEAAIMKAYRENAAFAQWLNDGMERFTRALPDQEGA